MLSVSLVFLHVFLVRLEGGTGDRRNIRPGSPGSKSTRSYQFGRFFEWLPLDKRLRIAYTDFHILVVV